MATNETDPNPSYHPESGWHREGELIYALANSGRYRKGEPLMENAVMIRISAHPHHVSEEQVEQITAYLHHMLNHAMPAAPDNDPP